MIAGIFHSGSGLGNQLHRYVATRVLALDKGYDFSMVAPENFKGSSFMNLDMGEKVFIPYTVRMPAGKVEPVRYNPTNPLNDGIVWEENSDGYNPEFNSIKDNTIIDGEFQGENYYKHRLKEIDEWLKVEPMDMPDDLCIMGFRGGEYVGVKDLFLPRSYWYEAMSEMRKLHHGIKFHVVTDDVETAQEFFSGLDLTISHDIGRDWRAIRYAKHLIIANSSFYILPSLLGNPEEVIAPEYWAGYNKGYWQLEQNQYSKFTYI